MGLATQMLGWPEGFCRQLAERGYRVVRFDNRDIGLSTHLDDAEVPRLQEVFAGDHGSVPYTLRDMATDTTALMDALGFESAHLVGASMGGMIAQHIAMRYPARVLSLTSIMATTGGRLVGQPKMAVVPLFLSRPSGGKDEYIERTVKGAKTYYRARFAGFDRDQAEAACKRLKREDLACMALKI